MARHDDASAVPYVVQGIPQPWLRDFFVFLALSPDGRVQI